MTVFTKTVLSAALLYLSLFTSLTFSQVPHEGHQKPAPSDKKAKPHEEKHEPANGTKQNHAGMPHDGPSSYLMLQASGTAANPASSPMEMITFSSGRWDFTFHSLAYLNDIQQTGPRGGDKLFSTNWVMTSAERSLAGGSLMFRSMMSLEPATITDQRYPLLFQTGETAFGRPIVDGQHPHDLFMELSVQYARRIGEKNIFNIYFAPRGDPALGPVAFPHRISAIQIPQATLGHHVQDSTHIADDVITAAFTRGIFRFEVSGFHGQEPDEERWDLDQGDIDSWSSRLTLAPSDNWVGQVSVGRLESPEELEPGDIVRATASITHNRPRPDGNWATSLIWGRNHKTAEQQNVNSYLVESIFQFRHKNYLTGRAELIDREELFAHQPEIQEQLERTVGSVFRVAAFTLGYTRDVELIPGLRTGFGGNFSFYNFPSVLERFYGDNPVGFLVYVRIMPKGHGPMQHGRMP